MGKEYKLSWHKCSRHIVNYIRIGGTEWKAAFTLFDLVFTEKKVIPNISYE